MNNLLKKSIISLLLALSLSAGIATATNFEAPLIPKPDLLPGPEKSQVKDEGGRKILTESVLPKFAIGFTGLVGGVALMFVVIGGVRYTMVYGNEEAAEKAKNQIIWAIVGFLVAILSYTIVTVINNLEYSDNQTPPQQAAQQPTN